MHARLLEYFKLNEMNFSLGYLNLQHSKKNINSSYTYKIENNDFKRSYFTHSLSPSLSLGMELQLQLTPTSHIYHNNSSNNNKKKENIFDTSRELFSRGNSTLKNNLTTSHIKVKQEKFSF